MRDFKILLVTSVLVAMSLSPLRAASMVLIYANEAAVASGKSTPAPETESGVIIPAATALTQGATFLIGDANGLSHGVLFRLDNDLNVAIVRRGDAITDAQIVGRHLKQWSGAAAFVSISSGSPAAPAAAVPAPAASGPFHVTVNGTGAESVVVLKNRFNKSKFTVNVVNTSTSPVWAISVRLTSDPKLSFWKEGRRTGLNEVPEAVLAFDRQAIIKPISPGDTVSFSAEAYYMKGKDYTWTVQTSAKGLSHETKLAVHIE